VAQSGGACDYFLQSVSHLSFLSNIGHLVTQKQDTKLPLKKQNKKSIIKTAPFPSLFMYI